MHFSKFSEFYNRAWTGKHNDPMTRHCASAIAAAIHTNLQSNEGTYSKTNCDPRSGAEKK
jgi:hypothetical protein